jgi:hypothetical protein
MIKVRGDNKANAQEQADAIMAKTIRCEKCEASKQDVNWDYFRCWGIVNADWVKEHRAELKITTVEELVQHYLELRKSNMKRAEKQLAEELKKFSEEYAKTKKFPRFTMLDYFIRKLDSLRNIMDYGNGDEGLYTLHCTENHYADMTEYTNGNKYYYFWYDRHY